MDKDLEFLKNVDDKYLDGLVDVIIKYDGGSNKIKAAKEEHTKYGTPYANYIDIIIDTYLDYGNDAFATVGSGIKHSYRHILGDVCKRFKVTYDTNKALEENEQILLEQALINAADDLSVDEMIDLIQCLYSKPKQTHLGDWINRFMGEFTPIPLICRVPNPPTLIDSLIAIVKDLYQEGKPALQVTIPCTLLIALYRKTV
ncbi:MAG: hypothetical protein Q4A54_06670 [Parabacteroides sp.]|nr:hypothetical protein [Parabacteroides sp.]